MYKNFGSVDVPTRRKSHTKGPVIVILEMVDPTRVVR